MFRGRGRRWRLTAVMASLTLLVGTAAVGADPAQAAPTGSIRGVVTAPNGTPVAGASVSAAPFEGTAGGASTTSRADGSYVLVGLPTGAYRVTFVAAGFGPPYYYPGTTDFFHAAAVRVADGVVTTDIDQHYTATGGISGNVRSAGGAALNGAAVMVTSTSGFGSTSATSGPDGAYVASGLADGTYLVNAAAPGHVSVYYSGALDISGAAAVTVTGGVVTTGIDVVLPLAGGISGQVTLADGTPAAGAVVTVAMGSRTGAASTAADGTYSIDGLVAGNYVVGFAGAGSPMPEEYYDDAPSTALATPVTVVVGTPTPPVDAMLGPDPSLGGTVFGDGDQPLPGATVTVTSDSGIVSSATTGADGGYLFTRLADGEYTVAFSAAGYSTRYYDGAVDAAGAKLVTIVKHNPIAGVDGYLHLNTAPAAVDDATDAYEGFGPTIIDVLANDTDSDGDLLRIVSVSATESGGTVTCSATSCSYLPPDDALIDHDQFSYTISDGALTDSAVVSVHLHPNAESKERDHGWHRVHMTAVLSTRDDASRPVKLKYCVRPGTARGRDVALRCGRATIEPGTDRALLSVWVKGDRRPEVDEYAVVDVTAVGGQLWDSQLTLVIDDDDARRPHDPG